MTYETDDPLREPLKGEPGSGENPSMNPTLSSPACFFLTYRVLYVSLDLTMPLVHHPFNLCLVVNPRANLSKGRSKAEAEDKCDQQILVRLATQTDLAEE